jgi:hypothetical protein
VFRPFRASQITLILRYGNSGLNTHYCRDNHRLD